MNWRGLLRAIIDGFKGFLGKGSGTGQGGRTLCDLDDHLLDDVGLTREQARELDKKINHEGPIRNGG